MSTQRPNVVIMISHDTGRFVSPYGYTTVNTPNFERLAQMSTTFDNCFCTTPLCAPARAALLTGLYPHQNGMMGLPSDTLGDWDMVRKDRHIAAVLKSHGYRTVLCGFEHESQDLFSIGFEEAIHGSGKGHNGGKTITGAGKDINNWFEANPGAGKEYPFYMQIGCTQTHREWNRYAEPYDGKGIWKAPYLIDDPDVDKEMAEFQGACNSLDKGLGEILDVFDERGLTDNTIFVITTDHGIDFPRAKGTLFDPGVEVLLFMRYDAGGWHKGKHCKALISHVDVYPTILEACNIPVPSGTAGRSFLDILTGSEETAVRDAVYLEKTYHDNYDPMRGLRTERYKYILNFDAQTLYDVRIATAPRYNWFRFPFAKDKREELYDLWEDPHETKNLADDPAYEHIRLQLKSKLARWMKETEDPLLNGPIPSPYHLRISREMKELAENADEQLNLENSHEKMV
ncbi:MAG: sulfatase [Clostridiales bacterium]|nr:sulfatase [Clostridiales bacterium]